MHTIHPSELTRLIREARGDSPGPSAFGYQPSRALTPEAGENGEEESGAAPALFIAPAPEEPPIPPVPDARPVEGLLNLLSGAGAFLGHRVQLTPEELGEVQRVLGAAVTRQLGEEIARVREASGGKRRGRPKATLGAVHRG